MKKLFYLVAIAVTLLVGATACTPDEEPNHEPAAASMAIYMEYSDFCLR